GSEIYNLVQPDAGRVPGFHDNLFQGLYDADMKAPYNNPAFFGRAPTYCSHFYNPDTGVNYLGRSRPTALTEGMKFFEQAVSDFQSGDPAKAGYHLGLSAHYFTDMTQPMHASNFPYFASFPIPSYHLDMEVFVMTVQGQVEPPTRFEALPVGDPKDL